MASATYATFASFTTKEPWIPKRVVHTIGNTHDGGWNVECTFGLHDRAETPNPAAIAPAAPAHGFHDILLCMVTVVLVVRHSKMPCAVNDASCSGTVLKTEIPAKLRGRTKDVLRGLAPYNADATVILPVCATHRKARLSTVGFDYWDMVDNLTVEQR